MHSVTFRDGGKPFTETATTGYSDLQVATINCRGRRGGPSQSLVPNVSPPTRIAQSTHEERGRLSGGSARAAGSGVRTRCCFPNTSRTRRLQNADIACASLAAKLAKVRGDETSKLAVRGVDKFVVLETHQRGPCVQCSLDSRAVSGSPVFHGGRPAQRGHEHELIHRDQSSLTAALLQCKRKTEREAQIL